MTTHGFQTQRLSSILVRLANLGLWSKPPQLRNLGLRGKLSPVLGSFLDHGDHMYNTRDVGLSTALLISTCPYTKTPVASVLIPILIFSDELTFFFCQHGVFQ